MTTATSRRRNMRAECCRACGTMCEPEQGYLYSDTNTSRRNRHTGRFLWFVKCESCHLGNKSRTTVAMERQAAARASEPVIRPWSIAQVKGWTVERFTYKGDAAIRICAPTFSAVISYRDRINSSFQACSVYDLEEYGVAGKACSAKAAAHISNQIDSIVTAVQSEERANGETAAARLTALGAIVTDHHHYWRVSVAGGNYTLWGCVN